MYSPEELKILGVFVLAAILGRLLFYRTLLMEGSFKERFKIRCLQWLWELPVIMAVALVAFETMEQFELKNHSGVLISVAVGYIGINTLKVWLEDWLDDRFYSGRSRHRRKESQKYDNE